MEEWKIETIEELRMLPIRKQQAEALHSERRMIEADAVSIGGLPMGATPVRGGGNRQELRLINLLNRCEKLEKKEAALRERVRVAEEALRSMDKRERAALVRYYVNQTSGIGDLERLLYVSRAEVYRLLNRGLLNFAKRMGYVE